VIGVVSDVPSATQFEITMIGEIFGNFRNVTDTGGDLISGRSYYLSPYLAGKITAVQPTASGAVHKAVFIATGPNSAMVIPFTGGVLASPLSIANASSVSTRINQYNRFSLGDVVRFKAYPFGVTLTYSVGPGATHEKRYDHGIYVKAQADTSEEAEVAGMVVGLNGATGTSNPAYESFDILMDGFFDLTGLALSTGNVYFLQSGVAGTTQVFESASTSY